MTGADFAALKLMRENSFKSYFQAWHCHQCGAEGTYIPRSCTSCGSKNLSAGFALSEEYAWEMVRAPRAPGVPASDR